MAKGYQITNPIGLHKKCQSLQDRLNDQLWLVADSPNADVIFHSLCYEFEDDGNIQPMLFDGDKGEYTELLHDDNKYGLVFFHETGQPERDMGRVTSNVDIIFAVNLKKLYPAAEHRASEEAIRDAFAIVNNSPFQIVNVEKEIDAYEDFVLADDARQDTQPYYLFKFITTVSYRYDNNCN